MLASTVQFSTNNQPTTPQPPTNPTSQHPTVPTLERYERPGHAWLKKTTTGQETNRLTNPPATADPMVVPSGPNRMLYALPSRTTTPFPRNPEEFRVLDVMAVAGSN